MVKDLASIRKEYTKAKLDASSINKDPITQFNEWFAEAMNAEIIEPTAMTLSTVNEHGRPNARIVLLKGVENGKFVFYTNYQSQKGKELEQNPSCSLTFFWPELERQVRIGGVAAKIDSARSEEYFQSRPRGSQLGAWASPQSSIIKDRLILEERLKQMEDKFKNADVLPKPNQWGGYEVDPLVIELWQGRPNRLHDRILYTRVDNNWKINRLAP